MAQRTAARKVPAILHRFAGIGGAALYAALMEAGILPEAGLETNGMDVCRMPTSGLASYPPVMEMNRGSLGQRLGIAVAWFAFKTTFISGLPTNVGSSA